MNDAPDKQFRRHLEAGRIMIQRSRETGRCFFYPRVAEPGTGSTDLEWIEACGEGTVYSTTVVRQRPPAADYNVVLVDLAEGPRLMSRVEGVAPEAVKIGMAVRARIAEGEDGPILVFDPAEAPE
ncbi:Zn-ribbon domain-containing OB-fold protein [Sphingosinicella terrae]|uniref:Zn-ribbon domain-containing OB-fold protein n=1 Tax=Sphingosinicella terrae TaxID=2172047 RepID=UPI000E0CCACF|nr:OB-fold domain-containing protein [Sphingosinicella terrae]